MKILRVIASMDPKGGGPSEGIRQVSRELALRGHQTECVTLDDPAGVWLKDQPLPVHAMGPAAGHYGYTARLAPWLRQNAPQYDAVIVSGIWQYHSLAARNALTALKLPYLVFTHGMLDPWFKTTYPLKHLKKMLYWPWADYRVLRDAHAVLFTSEEERIQARKSFTLYRANEVVVNYGTSLPPANSDQLRETFLQRFASLRGKRLLTFLSRIQEKKGCDLLIAAFARLAREDSSLHLVMAGPDQTGSVANLKAMADAFGVGARITWTGMLQGDLKWGALYASEAFVLPSHQENFGIAVAEALGCGVPVLISDKVNIWREIEAAGAGLVAPDTLDGTEQNLRNWIAMPEVARRRMVQCSKEIFLKRYTVQAMADSLESCIEATRSNG